MLLIKRAADQTKIPERLRQRNEAVKSMGTNSLGNACGGDGRQRAVVYKWAARRQPLLTAPSTHTNVKIIEYISFLFVVWGHHAHVRWWERKLTSRPTSVAVAAAALMCEILYPSSRRMKPLFPYLKAFVYLLL